MNLSDGQKANRNQALAHLKFKRKERSDHDKSASRSPGPTSNGQAAHTSTFIPPPQSRDATRPSRYFASAANSGIVLVPNSSPSPQEFIVPNDSPTPIGNGLHPSQNAVTASSAVSAWSTLYAYGVDPLSAPTQFTRASAQLSIPYQHPVSEGGLGLTNFASAFATNEPQADSSLVQGSPEVQRYGKRRKIESFASDEEQPSTGNDSHQASRIVRSARPASGQPLDDDLRLKRLKMLHPLESPKRVEAAYRQSAGDVDQAGKLLSDPQFSGAKFPSSPPHESTSSPNALTRDRDREIQKQSERAAVKEKSRHSTIYAKRNAISGLGTSPTDPISIPESPYSPAVNHRLPIFRKTRNRVVGSDSEPDWLSEDEQKQVYLSTGPPRTVSFYESQALKWFNESNLGTLMELTGCTHAQAEVIASKQPFTDVEDLKTKLCQGKRKAGAAGISPNIFEDCVNILTGYSTVDDLLDQCEKIGLKLREAIDSWTSSDTSRARREANTTAEDDAITLAELAHVVSKTFIRTQPGSLAKDVLLKEYQLIGLNWLNLLYSKKYSCILADEMGLGKTIQVISLFAHLKEKGSKGPHLVVVPSSTLENWCREFERFAPTVQVQTYYGGKDERPQLRQLLKETTSRHKANGWEVLITTYNLAQGDEKDRKFFHKMEWDTCVFDEGHVLKNCQSQRYTTLMRIPSKWRLLLTGTPLQNNLQELVSLMNFILPEFFNDVMDDLRAIFKVKADSTVSLLSRDRVSRAKKMIMPFMLRRRKDQVLKDLPRKVERIEWCEMTPLQNTIYREALQRSRKLLLSSKPEAESSADDSLSDHKLKKASKSRKLKVVKDSSSNVLMDLRKASSHPMLFRKRFTDQTITAMAKVLMQQPDFVKRRAIFEFVKEDMEVMTDAELQIFCDQYKATRKFALNTEIYLDSGKISVLMDLLRSYNEQGRRVLIFSQFTQVLDILQAVLKREEFKYLVLTGSTAVDVRQSLVDEFNQDCSITVFLLSTRAGGMGINLTAASVVVLFDQDFNPHNDRQAADRAYRIGQTRDVDVIKLISRGTIEEDMLRLGQTKLALDEAVAAEDGDKAEKIMKASLMSTIRQQFVDEEK